MEDSVKIATLEEQNRWMMKELAFIRKDIRALLEFKWKAVTVGILLGSGGSFIFKLIDRAVHL